MPYDNKSGNEAVRTKANEIERKKYKFTIGWLNIL